MAGGEGQGEGEYEGISGYPPVVLGGFEVAGGGLSTGDRAGGRRERWRRRSGVRGKEGPGWGGAVGAGEAEDATSLGRERAEEEVPRWQGLVGANGGAPGYWARASRTKAALYRQMGREEGGESE
jgi:hypothetical protein